MAENPHYRELLQLLNEFEVGQSCTGPACSLVSIWDDLLSECLRQYFVDSEQYRPCLSTRNTGDDCVIAARRNLVAPASGCSLRPVHQD